MNIFQRIDYKLGKTLQRVGLSYAPSVEAVQAWLEKFERPACHYYYSGDHVLLSAAPIEERLAKQYCSLAQQYAPNQEYVVFNPAYLAQDGPWTRAYVER